MTEEHEATLTAHERALTGKFKRVVTGGKGSRPVAVLFPKKIQKYIKRLLDVRDQIEVVAKNNIYLFALPGTTDRWLQSYHTIKKLAKNARVEKP